MYDVMLYNSMQVAVHMLYCLVMTLHIYQDTLNELKFYFGPLSVRVKEIPGNDVKSDVLKLEHRALSKLLVWLCQPHLFASCHSDTRFGLRACIAEGSEQTLKA